MSANRDPSLRVAGAGRTVSQHASPPRSWMVTSGDCARGRAGVASRAPFALSAMDACAAADLEGHAGHAVAGEVPVAVAEAGDAPGFPARLAGARCRRPARSRGATRRDPALVASYRHSVYACVVATGSPKSASELRRAPGPLPRELSLRRGDERRHRAGRALALAAERQSGRRLRRDRRTRPAPHASAWVQASPSSHGAPGGLELAGRRAAVAGGEVAVVALLAGGDDAVAAAGRRAVRVAAVAVDEIAVVALLGRLDDAVAAAAGLVGADVDARAEDARRRRRDRSRRRRRRTPGRRRRSPASRRSGGSRRRRVRQERVGEERMRVLPGGGAVRREAGVLGAVPDEACRGSAGVGEPEVVVERVADVAGVGVQAGGSAPSRTKTLFSTTLSSAYWIQSSPKPAPSVSLCVAACCS